MLQTSLSAGGLDLPPWPLLHSRMLESPNLRSILHLGARRSLDALAAAVSGAAPVAQQVVDLLS